MTRRIPNGAVLLWCVLCCGALHAYPTRPFSAGVGIGGPEFTFIEAQASALARCQVGATYGGMVVPGVIPESFSLETMNFEMSTGDSYSVSPKVYPSFDLLSPFIRFFPTEKNNFYIQFMWSMLRVNALIKGTFTPDDTGNPFLPRITLRGTVTIVQHLPTLSVGYFFSSQLFYFNLAIGGTYVMTATAGSSLGADIPELLGGEDNALPLTQLNQAIQDSVNQQTQSLREQYSFVPSLHVSFGFYF